MTTFTDRLAALPEWPEWPRWIDGQGMLYRGTVYGLDDPEDAEKDHQFDLADASLARLRLALGLLEEVANAGVVQSLRQYEELQVAPDLRANARALVEKVRGGEGYE
jgi:hypothetical protein